MPQPASRTLRLALLSLLILFPLLFALHKSDLILPDAWRAQRSSLSSGMDSLTDMPAELVGMHTYKWYTETKLRQLAACQARKDCPPNAQKIVMFATAWCQKGILERFNGGEGVWCRGMLESLERQGYTGLVVSDDAEYAYHIYRQIPNLVKGIVGQTERLTPYFKSRNRPDGIPAWKVFCFSYSGLWDCPRSSIVGDAWTVYAEKRLDTDHSRSNFTWLGYSLEPSPSETLVVPFKDRPNRVYVFSKLVRNFYPPAHPTWDPSFFLRAKQELSPDFPGFEFVGGFRDVGEGGLEVPAGVTDMGQMDSAQFDLEVARSKLMLGIGWPLNSPSPYRALAQGVPFLNPYENNGHNPDNLRSHWTFSQHNFLRSSDPPFVYQVHDHQYEPFRDAIRAALSTPIKPYRFDWSSREAVDRRMREWINRDWESEAARIMAGRLAGDDGQEGTDYGVFTI